MEVVINNCYGGFSLSRDALYWLAERGLEHAKNEIADNDAHLAKWGGEKPKGGDPDYFEKSSANWWADKEYDGLMRYSYRPDDDDLPRHSSLLVECVRSLGEKANGSCASLKIVEIPDGTDYQIEEYDGNEWIAEKHKTW